jgi:hypothetical protein
MNKGRFEEAIFPEHKLPTQQLLQQVKRRTTIRESALKLVGLEPPKRSFTNVG